MLIISDLTYRIVGRTLIEGASVTIHDGAKVGLVGRNGTGKTTLFNIVAGELAAESGSIDLKRGSRIGRVAQEAPGSDTSLIDFVLAADTERTALMTEAETATDPHRIAEIQVRLADIEAHSAEARAATILSGLGFDATDQRRPCADFSGGWRMRVALAAVLFTEPDLLLLDEPTNYLDLEGTLWLTNYVQRYPYTVVLISHDRDLLDTAVDHICHLSDGKLTLWKGGYTSFARQRQEKMLLQEKAREKIEARRKHLQAFVDRFRYKASKATQAQSRIKMLERLDIVDAVVEDNVRQISFPNPKAKLAPPIVTYDKVDLGYDPEKPVLKRLTLRIDDDDRIALLGKNGNGKSTFAKALADRLTPFSGNIIKAGKLEIAFFAQHQLDELHPDETAVAHVRRLMPDAPDARVRSRVAQMGLDTNKMDTPARELSGGEKARLLLGLATFHGPNLLILDEPTNHLDIDSRESLIQALNDFEGAVILVSHDRHLVDATMDRLWLVDKGTITPFDGDMDDYKRFILSGDADRTSTKPDEQKVTNADRRRLAAERRVQLAPLRKRIQGIEADMDKLRKLIARIDAALADPALFTSDPAKGARLSKERADALRGLDTLEEEWLTLSAEYEEAEVTEG
ncbi:ABC-F family ATP-binding cassette domain-containing protein [Pleomorphomonas sp. PLEO]|uniref:ABC-F family ATP-binding cassette domain-containing protein n=1 Tax=Pleomorphomonas sp. PLEO TaxID=3239306 RepID=UPI00351E9823